MNEMLTERADRLKKQKTNNHRSRERRFFLTEDGEGNIKYRKQVAQSRLIQKGNLEMLHTDVVDCGM